MRVDNAIIMAAGTSSRFAPLSYEKHKALTVVKDEVMIERQVRQILDAGISTVYLVTGYKAEQFEYLSSMLGVKLIYNSNYLVRNNNSSIWSAREIIGNSYICSADNYFEVNPFEKEVDDSYYAAEYADGKTQEWCISEDDSGYIKSVTIGGSDSWYMMGHAFWSTDFSQRFLKILEKEYYLPGTSDKLWEEILMMHLDELKMKIRKYPHNIIHEFDTFEELREFDNSYWIDTRSSLIKRCAKRLNVKESEITGICSYKNLSVEAEGFVFDCPSGHYRYVYASDYIEKEMR